MGSLLTPPEALRRYGGAFGLALARLRGLEPSSVAIRFRSALARALRLLRLYRSASRALPLLSPPAAVPSESGREEGGERLFGGAKVEIDGGGE